MSDNPDNAVVIERIFDGPVDLVWRMWTVGDDFQKWYGPQGFTIPTADFDLQVGGRRFVGMESPDGSMKMWFVGEFREVTAPTRLVYTESMADENGNVLSPADMGMPDMHDVTEITVELEDLGDKTRMAMTHAGVPADSPGAAGWTQAFDKLAVAVAEV
ncbi:MAG: SRPBCC domain-containing protein [Acidimicrobiia bacterium]|nr:SRPBCC domain-containing protein [Acidimicrobiia bacterium]